MQADTPLSNKSKDLINSKEFYNYSILKLNALSDLCNDITNSESLDINVEKFLADIADNYVESILDTACQISKHKKLDYLSTGDLSLALEKNFEIFEPVRTSQNLTKVKSNEVRNISTFDHKKRVELTREECKNIN